MNPSKRKTKLNGRDLITIGIFGAIGAVAYVIVTAILCTTVVGIFIASAVAALVTGIVYMLMVAKVRKRGVFFLIGVIFALISLTGGHFYHLASCLIGGLVAELCVGDYTKTWRIVLAYVVFSFFNFAGIYLPNFLLGMGYVVSRSEKYGHGAVEMTTMMEYYTMPVFWLISAANIVCAFFGALVGVKALKKHFRKAGLV